MGTRAESIPRYRGAQEGLPGPARECGSCRHWVFEEDREQAEDGLGWCCKHCDWYIASESCLDWKEA